MPTRPVPTALTSIARKLIAVLTAAIAATVLVAVDPAAAAGSITLSGAGDLIVNGTADHDHVLILAVGDTIEVEHRSGSDVSTRTFATADLRRDIVVNLRGGGGYIGVIQLDVPRDLKVNTGSGFNQIVYEDTKVNRNANIIDGSGELRLSVSNTTILGRSNISLGAGHNQIELRHTHFGGNTTLRIAASGRLVGTIDDSVFVRPARVTGGNDVDQLRVRGSFTSFGTATIDMRGGDDELELFDNARFKRTVIRGGSGNDLIDVEDTVMRSTYTIDMGSGDDITTMTNVASQGRGTINGGSGNGDLLGVVGGTGTPLRVRGVEGGYGY